MFWFVGAMLFIAVAFVLCLIVSALLDYANWHDDKANHRIGRCRRGCRVCADGRRDPAADGLSSDPGRSVYPGPVWTAGNHDD